MKKSITALLLTILLLPSSLVPLAFASSDTVSVDTGSLPIYSGVAVRLRYSAAPSFSVPSIAFSGSSNGVANIIDGYLNISVYLPAPISTWYNASLSIPIGSATDIPIYAGVQARVGIVASCIISGNPQTTLSWDSEGSKNFQMQLQTFFVESREVTCSFSFGIRLSLIVPIIGSIAEKDLGSFVASPSLTSNVFIIGIAGLLMFVILVVLIIVAVGLSRRGRRRTRTEHIVSRSCPSCGSSVPQEAYLCPTCGTSFVYCSSCGSIRAKTDEFCRNCGAKLPSFAREMNESVSPEPEPMPDHERLSRRQTHEPSSKEKEPHALGETPRRYCIHCGEGLLAEALFCSKCGKKQSDT